MRVASSVAWRSLHPACREQFVEADAPAPLSRLVVDAGDGWRSPLLRVPMRAGASGEPVLLVHTAGCRATSMQYGHDSLTDALVRRGYQVFLATHRGDVESSGPGVPDLASVATHDLPAAIDAIRADVGARAVHVMGFGLGALLALDVGARCRDEVASVAALAPPLRFAERRSDARSVALALAMLPPHWSLPVRSMSKLGVPWVDGTAKQAGPRRRGFLAYTADDVPVSFARRALSWVAAGRVELVPQIDLEASLRAARAPMLALAGADDTVASPEGALSAVRAWGGPAVCRVLPGYGHLDLLLGREVAADVHEPVLHWLEALRGRVWGRVIDARESA